MSIQVSRLTKRYGRQLAVQDVTFSVKPGEIVGFLGPNGAGKSTTMKIITGYLPPTSGTASVMDMDVVNHPMKVKRSIGYLGEHNPLYHDMFVHEYLNFAASLCGLRSTQKRTRVSDMIGLCGLEAEQSKKINALSKGYRQRIGLAQALIHDPAVLILDEPTSGLDPNQLIEIRKLIKAVSANKTVLFSSHILQEVKALCDRVLVIHHGSIVADDKLDNLMKGGDRTLTVAFMEDVNIDLLRQIPGVTSVKPDGRGKFLVMTSSDIDIRPRIVSWASANNLSLLEIKLEEHSLESVFSQLTQQETKGE
ncbi:MAG: gliding motility-associated ABC transporter ATP-binding subunit GldA [Cyclobacteriaceae bacterium]|nr:gliding motility-associated ABC transporter ATP-binding subunit GldA [Cyclobacteriaceae bacterium]